MKVQRAALIGHFIGATTKKEEERVMAKKKDIEWYKDKILEIIEEVRKDEDVTCVFYLTDQSVTDDKNTFSGMIGSMQTVAAAIEDLLSRNPLILRELIEIKMEEMRNELGDIDKKPLNNLPV